MLFTTFSPLSPPQLLLYTNCCNTLCRPSNLSLLLFYPTYTSAIARLARRKPYSCSPFVPRLVYTTLNKRSKASLLSITGTSPSNSQISVKMRPIQFLATIASFSALTQAWPWPDSSENQAVNAIEAMIRKRQDSSKHLSWNQSGLY